MIFSEVTSFNQHSPFFNDNEECSSFFSVSSPSSSDVLVRFDCNSSISTESDDDDDVTTETHNKKQWKCTYDNCVKAYCSKENLKLHIKNVHLNEKPYPCYFCNLRFSHRNGRIYHQKKVHLITSKDISKLKKDIEKTKHVQLTHKNKETISHELKYNQKFIIFRQSN
jgi:hypothetical protein